ncbi:MAG: hypothetical protein AABW93_04080 [Nanoarchaeota archaeon]
MGLEKIIIPKPKPVKKAPKAETISFLPSSARFPTLSVPLNARKKMLIP